MLHFQNAEIWSLLIRNYRLSSPCHTRKVPPSEAPLLKPWTKINLTVHKIRIQKVGDLVAITKSNLFICKTTRYTGKLKAKMLHSLHKIMSAY